MPGLLHVDMQASVHSEKRGRGSQMIDYTAYGGLSRVEVE